VETEYTCALVFLASTPLVDFEGQKIDSQVRPHVAAATSRMGEANDSKTLAPDGRLRWPVMDTISGNNFAGFDSSKALWLALGGAGTCAPLGLTEALFSSSMASEPTS
jgi:hypothetical protein